MTLDNGRIYEFGNFRLDLGEQTLAENGRHVPLTPKVFDLLALLVVNHGRLMTKEELISELWQDTFVEEANLNVNISTLRRVLGETPTEHRYIETVPRRGYKFVAPVREVPKDAPPPISPAPERRRLWFPLLLIGVLLTLFAGLMAWNWSKGSDAKADIRSLAVLPFRPLVPDQGDAALEMGMANALITKLGSLQEIAVRPTGAVTKFTTGEVDAVTAGRELQVDAVLEGKVQRAENKIRITVQLIGVADGAVIWAGSFDDFFTNIFAVQDSISERMAQSIALHVTPEEQKSLEKRYTESTEAYELFLQGQYHHEQISEVGSRRALEYYELAVAKDPEYALAWSNMVGAYAHLANLNIDRDKNLQSARNAAYRSVALDDGLPEAHEAVATVLDFFDWKWEEAEREYLRAIELGPHREGPHYAYSIFLSKFKRHDEAVREMRVACQISPNTVYVQDHLVTTLYRARRYDEALAEANKSLGMKPEGPIALSLVFRIYLQMGRLAEAEEMLDRLVAARVPQADVLRARLFLNTGRRSEGSRVIRAKIESYKDGDNCWPIAMHYTRLGDLDSAFEFLEKALNRREALLTLINVEPEWDPIRGDPRYTEFVRRLRLPG